MKNPYEILNVSQDATKQDIMKAKMAAMKASEHSLQEIQMAERQLLVPSKRLAADFMFPHKLKSKRPKLIKLNIEVPVNSFNSIDENAFDSLKL